MEMNWIPIDKGWPTREELPGLDVHVLISVGDHVHEAFRDVNHWWIVETEIYFDLDEVDAWMPKPKPYKSV